MWFIELGLCIYFILKRNRFLTTTIFTGSASTVHNSLKIMFYNFNIFVLPRLWYMLISAAYSVSGTRFYLSCSKVISIYRRKRLKNNMEKLTETLTKSFHFFTVGKEANMQEKISFYHVLTVNSVYKYVKKVIGLCVFLF